MIRFISSLFGLDIYVERMALSRGPFRFLQETHPAGDREFWALGLHIVVSPLEVSPR